MTVNIEFSKTRSMSVVVLQVITRVRSLYNVSHLFPNCLTHSFMIISCSGIILGVQSHACVKHHVGGHRVVVITSRTWYSLLATWVSPVRLNSPYFARRRRWLNLMYNVMGALRGCRAVEFDYCNIWRSSVHSRAVVPNLFWPRATLSLLEGIRGHNVIFKRNFSRYNIAYRKDRRLLDLFYFSINSIGPIYIMRFFLAE